MNPLDTRSQRIPTLVAVLLLLATLAPGTLASPAGDDPSHDPSHDPFHDPFLTRIEPPPPPERDPTPSVIVVVPTPTALPPPVQVEVQLFASAADESLAVISYRGAEYLVGSGWDGRDEEGFDGRFRVIRVQPGEIVLYDTARKQRQTVQP